MRFAYGIKWGGEDFRDRVSGLRIESGTEN